MKLALIFLAFVAMSLGGYKFMQSQHECETMILKTNQKIEKVTSDVANAKAQLASAQGDRWGRFMNKSGYEAKVAQSETQVTKLERQLHALEKQLSKLEENCGE